MKSWIALLLALTTASAIAEPQLIARLQPGADANAIARRYNIKLRDTTQNAPFALFGVPRFSGRIDVVQARLMTDPQVVWAEDNVEVSNSENQGATKGSTMPAIGGRSNLYAANTNMLQQINWSSSLANSAGRTVRIAILDTGLSTNQAYLWEQVDASYNFVEPGLPADDQPRNTDTNRNGKKDEGVGHGTMIAGIVDQIAPKCRMIIARVMDSDGIATAWTVTKGLAYAATNDAEVANLSAGSPTAVAAISDVMDWCEEQNLLVVCGIGNANQDRAFYPARIQKVVCVAGLNPNNTKAAFSNWDGHCDSAAPATGIISQWWDGHMGTWNGTSFSSPMVAAAVADCLRRTPSARSSVFLHDAVFNSGTDIDGINRSYRNSLGTLLNIQNLNTFISGG